MRIEGVGGTRILFLETDGPALSTAEETSDLIGNAWFEHVGVVAIPVERIDPAFFDLSSQFAGQFAQKAVNYRVTVAVIGDIGAFESRSAAFRDFVWESNRGEHIWFVPDEATLTGKLATRAV
ncbi:DUF4180 domain-containing protein [Conyzicola nivalis]|nr:DUF4180 domain-containing protein [Conyzicola nivalis]